MIKFVMILFLCLCATSASATFEIIDPTSIGSRDDLDSTTGGTKPVIITDQDEATYIFMAGATGSDIYNVGDLTATDIDVVDSVVLYYKAQDNGTGANKVQIIARINLDTLKGTNVNLTTSWVDYSDGFTIPPGSRGTWDDFEVDSLLFQIVVTAIGGSREVRIAECSVVVWYSSNNRTLMYPEKDDACLSGTNYDYDLRRKSAMLNDTAFVYVNDGTTSDNFWKTGDAVTGYHKMNNDDWETGGFGIFLDVIHVKADCSLQVIIQRYNSSCTIQESTPSFPTSGPQILVDTTGHYEIQIPQYDWSSGACGDELAVRFIWTNSLFEADDSVWVLYGSPHTYLEHEIKVNGTGCGAEVGFGDCAGQSTTDTVGTVPAQEGGIAQWAEDAGMGAGGLIAAIADNVDGNYMFEITPDDSQEVQFNTLTEPSDLSTYDSVAVFFRAQRNLDAKPVRIRVRLQDSTASTSQFCETGNINIPSTSWVDFDNEFTVFGAPNDSNSCEGAFSTAEINLFEVCFLSSALGGDREIRITSVDLVICYTLAVAGGGGQVIRIQLGIKDDPLNWAEKQWWAGIEHPLYPERGTVWSVQDSRKWIWDK